MNIFTPLWISAGVLTLVFLFLWSAYNSFITERNKVKTFFADIDVQLKRRASLIENLVALVREYAKHEKSTFEDIAKARSALLLPHGPQESAKIEGMLSGALKSLLAVSENYPKLLASENYQSVQNDLRETENTIAGHREAYNQSVLDYNTMLQTFPNLLAARLFDFKEEELFEPKPGDTLDITLASA